MIQFDSKIYKDCPLCGKPNASPDHFCPPKEMEKAEVKARQELWRRYEL